MNTSPPTAFHRAARQIGRWLTAPSPQLRETEARRNAQLMAILIVALFPVWVLAQFYTLIQLGIPWSQVWVQMEGALAIAGVGYALSRTRHYYTGLLTLTFVTCGIIILFYLWLPSLTLNHLIYLIIPLMFVAIFSSTQMLLVMTLVNVVALLLLPLFHPALTWNSLFSGPLSYYLLVAAMGLLSGFSRDRLEEERQSRVDESQARYRAMVEYHTDLICRYRPDGVLTFVNEAYCRFFGRSRESLLQESFIPLLYPEDRARVMTYLATYDSRQTVTTNEYRVLAEGEQLRWLQWVDRPISNRAGQIIEFQSVGRDITDRVWVESEIQRQNEFLANVLESLTHPFYVINAADYTVAMANSASTHSTEDEHLPCYQRLHGQSQACEVCPMEQVKVLHKPVVMERCYTDASGPRFFEVHAYPVFGTHGEVVQVIEYALDVTQRKRAELTLQQRATQLAVLNDISGQIVSLLDVDRVIERVVHLVQERFDYHHVALFMLDSDHEALNMKSRAGAFADLFPPHHSLMLGQGMVGWVGEYNQILLANDVEQEPRYVNLFPHLIPTQSELSVPIKVSGELLGVLDIQSPQRNAFDENDVLVMQTLADQIAVALIDAQLYTALEEERESLAQRVAERTAELSKANAELARAARLKDEFLASMSHELRTPLNAILGMSETLLDEVYGPLNPNQRKSAGIIETSGRHLLKLINDILDLSKIEAGKLELQMTPISVISICQASLQFVKQQAIKSGVEIQQQLDPQVTLLLADERRLKQILVNLLTNAVKFTPAGGTVGLEVTGDSAQRIVRFCVWDTGIGIAEEDLERLFKPFMQLDSSLARQYEGTGLGLSLVRRLVELHGGSIALESRAGHGSRFTISLPWIESDQSPPPEAVTPLPPPPSRVSVILLVEDNEANIDTISRYLHRRGYAVQLARNGREALAMLQNPPRPDLVLMDIQMPDMDGFETLRHVRANPELAELPIIAVTALAMPGDRERCLAAGANDYLSKPVSLKHLIQVIEMYV